MATDDSAEIQRLYEIAAKLDVVDKIDSDAAQYEAMYDEILQGSKGAQKTKILAAQFIPKYLKHFPKFTDKSINCLIDLCEEEDVMTRVHAIRALPVIAKITPEYLPKLADILGQLLQAEDPKELDRVKQALVSLLQQDLQGTLATLFTQSLSEDEDLRIKAIAFIFEKVVPMRDEINKSEDIQKFVAENVKKVLPHVISAKEFQLFMDLLLSLKIYIKGASASELLDFLADINADFTPTEDSHIAKLSSCMQSATEFLKRGASSTKFMQVLGEKVLPTFDQMTDGSRVDIIQQLSDTSLHLLASDAKALLTPVYELIVSQLPSPPAADSTEEPKLHFSIIESTLFVFHNLASKTPGSLRGICGINVVTGQPSAMSTELAVDKKQDLDARLKYLEQRTKEYVKQMEQARKGLTTQDNNKILLEVAIKATRNILLLAQNLLQRNPVFPGPAKQLALSFRSQQSNKSVIPPKAASSSNTTTNTANTATKPTKIETKSGGGKTARPAFEQVYVPPNRQQNQEGKKRSAESDNQQPQTESQKRFKGRGSSKFQAT